MEDSTTTRWWLALTSTMLIVMGTLIGWAYSSMMHRIERIEDGLADVRRIQATRGEDIIALRVQVNETLRQLIVSQQEHHQIEEAILGRKR